MRRIALLSLLLSLAASLAAAAPPRLIDAMEDPSAYTPAQPELGHKWTGAVSLDTTDFKEGKGCLRFDINSARADEETYPQ